MILFMFVIKKQLDVKFVSIIKYTHLEWTKKEKLNANVINGPHITNLTYHDLEMEIV
jgi:hypothetical protein